MGSQRRRPERSICRYVRRRTRGTGYCFCPGTEFPTPWRCVSGRHTGVRCIGLSARIRTALRTSCGASGFTWQMRLPERQGWPSIPGSVSEAASSIRFSLLPGKEAFTCRRLCCFGGHPVYCLCRFQVSFRKPRCSMGSRRLSYSRGYRRLPYILGSRRCLCSQRFWRRTFSRGQFASLSQTARRLPVSLPSGMWRQPGQLGKRKKMSEIRIVCLMRISSPVCIRRGRRAERRSGKRRSIWSFWKIAFGIFPLTER